jgi:hypothetical protein
MDIIQEAFKELYPGRGLEYDYSIKYSRKFKGYNANVKISCNNLSFHLSRQWKDVSKDIRIGLIQELMVKIFKKRAGFGGRLARTMKMDFYNNFMKQVHLAVPKTKTNIILEESFDRVNSGYFGGMIDKPNLEFGSASLSKLGSYEYGTDTISISTVLKDHQELLDYVMYHEMLHKKYKFNSKNGRSYHHTREFRIKEKEFENSAEIEKKLGRLAVRKRIGRFFSFFESLF